MGSCPANHSLDRIDNDKDYSPENCRWASYELQCKNRGDFNRIYSYKGETLCLKDIAKKYGIRYQTLHMRLKRHPEMSIDEAINYSDPNMTPIIYDGKEYSRKELCERFNIPLKLFYDRWHKGWPIERIIETPKLKSRYDERNCFAYRKTKGAEL